MPGAERGERFTVAVLGPRDEDRIAEPLVVERGLPAQRLADRLHGRTSLSRRVGPGPGGGAAAAARPPRPAVSVRRRDPVDAALARRGRPRGRGGRGGRPDRRAGPARTRLAGAAGEGDPRLRPAAAATADGALAGALARRRRGDRGGAAGGDGRRGGARAPERRARRAAQARRRPARGSA